MPDYSSLTRQQGPTYTHIKELRDLVDGLLVALEPHVLATTSALGPYHTVSGLTAGQVLRASSATAAVFAAIADADLPATIVRTSRTITSGNGLTGGGDLSADRTLAVGAGDGLTVAADAIALTTPGTCTVSSTNNAASNHTHQITSSANPGAAAALLASTAAGELTLQTLVSGTISPLAASAHDLGTTALEWANLFIGTGKVYLGADQAVTLANTSGDLDIAGKIRGSTAYSTRVKRTTSNQAISNGSWTNVEWNGEDWDNATMHDNTTDNHRLVAPVAGVYLVTASICFDTNSTTNSRGIQIVNQAGTSQGYGFWKASAINKTYQVYTCLVNLAATDWVAVQVYQDDGSGTSIDLVQGRCWASFARIA